MKLSYGHIVRTGLTGIYVVGTQLQNDLPVISVRIFENQPKLNDFRVHFKLFCAR